jgi:uncharacterized membrane protein YphA (DoxX/SURF4 family)
MMRDDRWNVLRTVLAWMIGLVFIYAAVLKIANPADFAQNIKYYKILPPLAVNATALLLPWWELCAGAALFLPAWRRAAAVIAFFMTCVFIAAVTSAVIRGLDISCGCFGQYSTKVGVKLLAFDFAILFAAGFILWRRPTCTSSGSMYPPCSEAVSHQGSGS